MRESLVQRASEQFNKGSYEEAFVLYRELSAKISKECFSANLQICINRLNRGNSVLELDRLLTLDETKDEFVSLAETPVRVTVKAAREDSIVDIYGEVDYGDIDKQKHPHMLVAVSFFNVDGKRVEEKYKGFAKSDKYGDFSYLGETQGRAKLFTLYFPKNSFTALLEFYPFLLKSGGAVRISNQLHCKYSKSDSYVRKSDSSSDLSIYGWPSITRDNRVRMMSIFDEFSRECFYPHANLIEPRPDNAIPLLERDKPELLFVESTWRGNKSTWQYRVAQYSHPPGRELSNLVGKCNQLKIPTIFWNKEDPVHFANFIDSAASFDYIFTTAEEAIPQYLDRSNAKVHALPFAAESSLHNPIGSSQRNDRVCFAGSYYANRFKERRDDQLMLLDAASDFNFDIFDRNSGAQSKDFCFPERFDAFVRGKLPYTEMGRVYRQYRLFLNVNSVVDSNTMFSRRVFELLACGTPVVSTISKGIEDIFGQELVWVVRNKGEAREAINCLMNDDQEWRKRSIQGIREVFAKHTFAHRFDEVLRITGVRENILSQHRILVVGEVSNQVEANRLVDMLSSQALIRTQVRLLILSKSATVHVDSSDVKVIGGLYELHPTLIREANSWGATHIGLLDSHAFYGKYYLQDALNAFEYTDSTVVGKPDNGIDSYSYGDKVARGGLVMKIDCLEGIRSRLSNISNIRSLEKSCLSCLAKDQVFVFDAANFFKREVMAGYANRAGAAKRNEI